MIKLNLFQINNILYLIIKKPLIFSNKKNNLINDINIYGYNDYIKKIY